MVDNNKNNTVVYRVLNHYKPSVKKMTATQIEEDFDKTLEKDLVGSLDDAKIEKTFKKIFAAVYAIGALVMGKDAYFCLTSLEEVNYGAYETTLTVISILATIGLAIGSILSVNDVKDLKQYIKLVEAYLKEKYPDLYNQLIEQKEKKKTKRIFKKRNS